MPPFTIFTDLPLSHTQLESLRESSLPHRLILASNPVTSVLSKSERDPNFLLAEIAFGQPDLESIYASENLRWIQVTSAGYTRYDTPEFREYVQRKGIIVTNSSAVFDEPCAAHTLSFILAQERQLIPSLQTRVANGAAKWVELRQRSGCLHGKRILILGYGSIAQRLQSLLAPFEVELIAFRRRARGDEGIPVIGLETLPHELAKADYVINILPESASTRDFMDAERFASMKPGSVYINIGRGTTNVQSDLADALMKGHLSAAWLDVTNPEPLPDDHPLWQISSCYITPHTAGGHGDEIGSLMNHFSKNLKRYENGLPLENRIF